MIFSESALAYHETNRPDIERGLRDNDGGNWIVIYSKELSQKEEAKLAVCIAADVTVSAGSCTNAYFSNFAKESLQKLLQETIEKAPAIVDQVRRDLTRDKILGAIKSSFNGKQVGLTIAGMEFQVGRATYNRAECLKVFGEEICTPTPNTYQPYIRFRVARTPSINNEQQKIIGYYRDFLSREPGSDEIDSRMNAYRNGYPLERQRTDIAFSDEVRQKITGFYRQYLGRNPESGAIEFRMNALLNGRTLEQQRVDIQTSPEARSRR
jgi:hypothetical protein